MRSLVCIVPTVTALPDDLGDVSKRVAALVAAAEKLGLAITVEVQDDAPGAPAPVTEGP